MRIRRYTRLILASAALLLFLSSCAGGPESSGRLGAGREVAGGPGAVSPGAGREGTEAAGGAGSGEAPGTYSPLLQLDPQVGYDTLENGLTYYVRRNTTPENRVQLRLVVDAGSVLEREDQLGLAHFVEHMAFNGTEEYEKNTIIDYLEKSGMSFGHDINAYTSFDQTVYKLDLPTDDPETVLRGLDILKEWAFNIAFDPEEVDKERQVIIEEWRSGRSADSRLRDEYLPVLLRGSRYAERLPIGSMDVIRRTTAADLKEFYDSWYLPDNMAVIIVGDIDPEKMSGEVRRIFSPFGHEGGASKPAAEGSPELASDGRADSRAGSRTEGAPKPAADNREENAQRPSYSVPEADEPAFILATDPEARRIRVQIIRLHNAFTLKTEEDYRTSLALAMYNQMVGDRLSEKTEQADPPYVSGYFSVSDFLRNDAATLWGATAREGQVDRALRELLVEAARVERFGFTGGELQRARENILSWLRRAYEERDKTESQRLVNEYVAHFLSGEAAPGIEKEWELARRFLPEITLNDIRRVGREIVRSGGRETFIITGPEKRDLDYITEAELQELAAEVNNTEIQPYRDDFSGEEFFDRPLTPGTVTAEIEAPDGVYRGFTLSNGARVLYRQTDFKNEEILFSAFSPGGASLIDTERYFAARLGPNFVDASGLAGYSPSELKKQLAGRQVSVNPYIGELFEGFSGSTRPEDLELLYQLVHLYFTSIREAPDLFASYQQRLAGVLANRGQDPQVQFSDRISELLFEDHPRRAPVTAEVVQALDPDDVYGIFRERFSSPSDFTFVFVGNVDPVLIRDLSARYLGSIPARPAEEWRDTGVRYTDEAQSAVVNSGIEEKSSVVRLYPGDYTWSLEENTALSGLEQLLDIRLREEVREEAGGTYSVGVSISTSRYPEDDYLLTINFSTDPARVEELSGIIETELRSLQESAVDESYLEKIRSILTKSLEDARQTNEYWLGTIGRIEQYGLDPAEVFAEEERIRGLTAEGLREAAARYISGAVLVEAVLYPAEYQTVSQ
ncbi:MAG: M16 family metallopeptidase [Sediminispirochaetaceae bacterium]